MFTLWISINTMSLAFALWMGGHPSAPPPDPCLCKGNVTCWVGPAKAQITFEAREAGTTPAGGVFHYRDATPTGFVRTFRLKVTRVAAGTGPDAVFVGRVDQSNIPGWRERWVKVWVRDHATPGRLGDQITFRFEHSSQGAWLLTPLTYFPVTGGDLTVQK